MTHQIFRKGETVIVHDGSTRRSAVELGMVGADSYYSEETVLITYGAFNLRVSKVNVHKAPQSLKKALKLTLAKEKTS